MTTRRLIPVVGFVLGVCTQAHAADTLVPTEKLPTYTVCMDCHGPIGDSVKPSVPRLNGQQAEYLKKRLNDFHFPGSQDPHATEAMWSVVEAKGDEELNEIAEYYARQPRMTAQRGRPLAEQGRRIYENGNAASYVPACSGCHGAEGEGRGAVPRLAGQHALYLTNQLERMRLNLRASDVMHPKTNSMTDKEIEALVAYLAGDETSKQQK